MCIDMFWYPQQNCMACRELLVWEGTWRPTRPANKLPGWCLMSKSDCINIKQFFNWLRITLNVEHRTGKGILWAVRLHLSRPFLFFSIVWKVAARHKKQAEKCVRSPWLGSRYFHDCSCQCVKCCGKTMTVLPLPDQRLRKPWQHISDLLGFWISFWFKDSERCFLLSFPKPVTFFCLKSGNLLQSGNPYVVW